jgi:hypothetical protein
LEAGLLRRCGPDRELPEAHPRRGQRVQRKLAPAACGERSQHRGSRQGMLRQPCLDNFVRRSGELQHVLREAGVQAVAGTRRSAIRGRCGKPGCTLVLPRWAPPGSHLGTLALLV